MTSSSEVLLRLTGGLLTCGEDWSLTEFGDLFRKLENEIDGPGPLRRYIRYFGETGDRTEVRFFGRAVESEHSILDGMVSLELGENEIAVSNCTDSRLTVSWRSRLSWDWLDRSNSEFPVGEFTASVPTDWISGTGETKVKFILSANSYSWQGNVPDDNVHLVDHNPAWSGRFEEKAAWLRNVISPDIVLQIEHYGSTAIQGIPAKPIIDVLLEVPSFTEARQSLIPLFNKPYCEYWWYDEHMLFIVRDTLTGIRTHHIHAAPKDHRVWRGLVFRDYLRTHPDEAQRYAALKYQLAVSHGTDREAYTGMKADFVREITERALQSGI